MPLFQRRKRVTLQVSGMSCEHCEMRVGKALLQVQGVEEAKASHERGEAVVTLASGLDKASEELMGQLARAVEEAGYEVTT